jgi:hypothetical protein
MRRPSTNTRRDTPLAREYRAAKVAYHKAGKALRASCAAAARKCGYPRPFKLRGKKRFKYVADNVRSMKAAFLGTPADGGTNESIVRAQLGHMDVKDATQWEPIAEKYEARAVETFDQAFAVLARESRKDWRKFDIEVLRSCPGLDEVDLPAFMHEAKSQEQIEQSVVSAEEVPF